MCPGRVSHPGRHCRGPGAGWLLPHAGPQPCSPRRAPFLDPALTALRVWPFLLSQQHHKQHGALGWLRQEHLSPRDLTSPSQLLVPQTPHLSDSLTVPMGALKVNMLI